MSLKLMYITNEIEIAQIAENSGVDWIFIDLEINGKEERQGHLDTVISRHQIEDVKKIKSVLRKSELLVRVNPIYEGSKAEIDQVIQNGADIVMLPFFETASEVKEFVCFVSNRAKVMLLLETPKAVKNIEGILEIEGIDFIHIGLNDLHLEYGLDFMFELLADGTVEKITHKISKQEIPYGFGGIARLGQGALPAENILAEHYRLGSAMVILSRSFLDLNDSYNQDEIQEVFEHGIHEVRSYEKKLENENDNFFEQNHIELKKIVNEIIKDKVN